MNYIEEISKIKEKIKNKDFVTAENMLLTLIAEAKIKDFEDEQNTHYSFSNIIQSLLYFANYKPQKLNVLPDVNYSEIYFYLGFINNELKKFEKASEYLQTGLKWNPVDVYIMFELAATYRMSGDTERFKAQIEKTHKYIYESPYLGKYFRELGWYYSEKRIFDIANALYTRSMAFIRTELAQNELNYIAKEENREFRYSTKEEIQKLFAEYNIEEGFNKQTFQNIYTEYLRLKKEKPGIPAFKFLSNVLYDITLDKQFMLYTILKNETYGVSVRVPESWKFLKKEAYKEYNLSPNTAFYLRTPSNEIISIITDGKCAEEQLDEAYALNIENMKKAGSEIIGEYSVNGQRKIKQVFVETRKDDKVFRTFQNYIIANGYLFNVAWQVPTNVKIEDLYKGVANSHAMDVVWSLRKTLDDTQKIAVDMMNNLNELNNLPNNIETTVNGLRRYLVDKQEYKNFEFYFPENLGEYVKNNDNIFEIKKDGVQKIRVMVSKCDSENNLEEDAKKWIEKNKNTAQMEEVSYKKEKIKNIPLEVYVLKFKDKPNLASKIYKIGYYKHCRITISGGLVEGKEKIIDTAFEMLQKDEIEKKPIQNTVNNKFENDLKNAYIHYIQGNLAESIKVLDKNAEMILINDKTLNQDIFWKVLSSAVYKAAVLNVFYNNKDLDTSSLKLLLENQEEMQKNVKEFCSNFNGKPEVRFIGQLQGIGEKQLLGAIRILRENYR